MDAAAHVAEQESEVPDGDAFFVKTILRARLVGLQSLNRLLSSRDGHTLTPPSRMI